MKSNSSFRFKLSALQLLLEQSSLAFVAVLINSTLYTIISWNFVNRWLLASWLLITYLFTGVRFIISRVWLRKKLTARAEEIDKLIGRVVVGVGISGFLWGLTGSVLVVPEVGIHLAVTTFLLAGMSAGAVGAYSISLKAVYLYLFPALVPFIIRLFLETDREYHLMALMGALFLVLMALIGRNVNKRTIRFVELGFENEDLITRLNNASHEIRTPVAAIGGFAELLKNDQTSSETVRKFSDIIYRNSIYLKKLVENTLFLSKAPTFTNQQDLIILKEEISSIIQIIEKRLSEKQLTLNLVYETAVPDRIYTSSLKFQQILINLLNNAIKFTATGGAISVAVSYSVLNGRLLIRVADTGIGISLEVRDKLFEPFFRENRPEVKSQEGSGLGLALSLNLARNLGGELRLVKSQINEGSVFEFEIDVKLPPEEIPQKTEVSVEQGRKLVGKTIVLVDDSEDIQLLVRNQLEAEGALVEICSDGSLAVELISKSTKNYDLILMDLNMPTMDGYLAAELIRKTGYTQPILALTAYSSLDQEKYIRSGFNEYITKPIGFDDFILTINKWFGAKRSIV